MDIITGDEPRKHHVWRRRRTVRLCPHCGQLPVWPCNACGDEHRPRREGEGTDRFRLGEEECSDWAA